MRMSSLIVDDFLEDFSRWRKWLDGAEYRDVSSGVDGVTYPHICSDLDEELRGELVYKLRAWTTRDAYVKHMFARMSPHGVRAPHAAHNDAAMGQWSMMLYMNRAEHCRGGTALLEYGPHAGEPTREEWLEHTNCLEMWRDVGHCDMRPNRAFIFPAAQWHCALPSSGFGHDSSDARMVITAFFNT